MVKKFAVFVVCLACLCGNAMAQDAKTVIANAQKALGDPKSITYSGSAKDVAFQQCGSNAADMNCRGTHDPMRPINNYVRVIDLTSPSSRQTGATNNPAGGGATTPMPGTFFQQVTAQQADVSQPWATSLEFYITPWGFLKGAAANNATISRRKVKGHTVLTWSPTVKAPSGKSYFINGFVNEQGIVDQVETWLGDNIMGDMHILATYSGWKDFGGVMAPAKIVQTRGDWPYFEVDVTAAKANPADVATLIPAPAPAGGRGGGGAPPAPGEPPPGEAPREEGSSSAELTAYREAYSAWRAGDAQVCIDRFRNFLQTYPSSAHADDAAYWMADCYFKNGDFKTAVLRFDDVVARYPKGNKAADALYRQGEALLRLGPNYGKAAGKAFERVVKEYPTSALVPQARRQLEVLKSG